MIQQLIQSGPYCEQSGRRLFPMGLPRNVLQRQFPVKAGYRVSGEGMKTDCLLAHPY